MCRPGLSHCSASQTRHQSLREQASDRLADSFPSFSFPTGSAPPFRFADRPLLRIDHLGSATRSGGRRRSSCCGGRGRSRGAQEPVIHEHRASPMWRARVRVSGGRARCGPSRWLVGGASDICTLFLAASLSLWCLAVSKAAFFSRFRCSRTSILAAGCWLLHVCGAVITSSDVPASPLGSSCLRRQTARQLCCFCTFEVCC